MPAKLTDIGKTIFSCAGYILHKTGSAVVFISSLFGKNNSGSQASEYVVITLSSSSIFYLSCSTRVPAYWKKISSGESSVISNQSQMINAVCYIFGTMNSLFTSITGFISSTTLFKFLGISNLRVVYFLGSYVGLSNFITFQTYNLDSMKKNSYTLAERIHQKKFEKKIIVACIVMSIFGISAMGAMSYFLVRKFFEAYLSKIIPDTAITALASTSFVISVATASLSKGLETYSFFSARKKCAVHTNYPVLIIPNIIFALLYLGSMSLIYQISFVELLKSMGSVLPTIFNELLALPFSLSAAFLEYIFNVKAIIGFQNVDQVDSTQAIPFIPTGELSKLLPHEDDSNRAQVTRALNF